MRLTGPATPAHRAAGSLPRVTCGWRRTGAMHRPGPGASRRLLPALSAVLLLLTACSSQQDYASTVKPAIRRMAAVLRTYNRSQTRDLATTAAACRSGADQLNADSGVAAASPPDSYRTLARALTNAYRLARAGFTDCALAGTAGSYLRMVVADREIAQANYWIGRARRLDH